MSKKIISILLICCFLSGMLAVGVGAAESDTPAWNFDANGQLTVNAASALTDYTSAQDVPWNLFTSLITSVSIDSSVSYIGAYSLNNLNAAVHIENGNTDIAEHAFDNAGGNFVIVSVYNSPVHTYAKEHGLAFEGIAIASGSCGTNARWSIYSDGTLHIHGSGAMTDYYRDPTSTPWYSHKSTIKSVVVDETITFVSPYTVFSASGCKSATIYGKNTQVSATAFQMVNTYFKIYGHLDSSAQTTAEARGYTFVPFTIASGTCGENATWALYTNGLLKIDGFGDMMSTNNPKNIPYYEYGPQITAIEIGEGITKLAPFTYFATFTSCASLTVWNPQAVFDPITITPISSSTKVELRGYSGSTAQKYAEEKSLSFAPCSPILAMGRCGTTANWQLHENGVLRIYGSGDLRQNVSGSWYNYAGLIQTIDISEDITRVGSVITNVETACTKLIIRNPSATINSDAVIREDKNLTVCGTIGSTAETYAKENSFKFTYDPFVIDYGSCGTNATWALYKNGLLFISGSGAMDSSYTVPERAPWYTYAKDIKEIKVDSNITSIASFTYFGYPNCISFTVRNSKATFADASIALSTDNLTIYGYKGSTAEAYAYKRSITFVALD